MEAYLLRSIILAALVLLVPLAAAAYDVADDNARVTMAQRDWLWPVHPHVEPICATFTNDSPARLVLPEDPPWWVEDSEGRMIYAPGVLTVNVDVPPGGSYTSCIENAEIELLLPGEYVMAWPYWQPDPWRHHVLRAPFALTVTIP